MAEINTPKAIFNTIETTKTWEVLPTSAFYPAFSPADYACARNFLLAYKNNKETFKTYRREVERFLQWAWLIHQKSILAFKREDIEAYIDFCQKPPKSWIGFHHVPRYIIKDGQEQPNPKWAPFVVELPKFKVKEGEKPSKNDFALSQAALKVLFSALSSFYNFLIQEEKIFANPVSLIKQKGTFIRKKQATSSPIRRLSPDQWQYVMQAAREMYQENPQKHNRTLFIVEALYGMYLRISELVVSERWSPQMNSFYKDADENWWFKVVGKGNKERDISVSDDMLRAFKEYRLSLNLTPLPSAIDTSPLIPKFIGKGGVSDTRHVRGLVQSCFDRAYQLMLKENRTTDAAELKIATVHWLRHTGISDDVKIRPREHVRDDAGHSSGAITDKYIDIEKRARSLSAKKKKII
jgi:site-specific recombinase XerD